MGQNKTENTRPAGQSQCYIGAPNGIVLCLDRVEQGNARGRFFQSYRQEPTEFHSYDQLVFQIEKFLNALNYPMMANSERSFLNEKQVYKPKQERTKIMSDEELLSRHGDMGTFVVRVQHRQNSSWQGRLTWLDQNKTVNFRSIWEMIKLIEGAVDSVLPPEEREPEMPDWFSDEK